MSLLRNRWDVSRKESKRLRGGGGFFPDRVDVMRTVVAVLVCGLELIGWAVFSRAMGWQRLGGILPMLILFSIVAAT